MIQGVGQRNQRSWTAATDEYAANSIKARIMNWHYYKETLSVFSEIATHPSTRGHDANLFRSASYESTEIEYLDFLNTIAIAKKPRLILETGSHSGISTVALAFAQQHNSNISEERFSVLSIEIAPTFAQQAGDRLKECALDKIARVIQSDSIDYLKKQDPNQKYCMVYLDSSRESRPQEFFLLNERQLLTPGAIVIFHDTGEFAVSGSREDQLIQDRYLEDLRKVELHCTGKLVLDLSRGLTIFQV